MERGWSEDGLVVAKETGDVAYFSILELPER
jgi:hypothetical protein